MIGRSNDTTHLCFKKCPVYSYKPFIFKLSKVNITISQKENVGIFYIIVLMGIHLEQNN